MTLKKAMIFTGGVILAAIAAAAIWMFGPALLPPERIEAGVAVGDKVPIALELRDSRGQVTTLTEHMGEKGMVLLLVRSADWCPFCKAQLARTQEIRDAVTGRGYALAALSYDEPEALARFAGDNAITYVLFSDKGSRMIDALGLRDPQYDEGSFAWGVPRASILYLAPDGTVLEKYVAADYRSRPSNEGVMAMLDGLNR